MSMFKYGCDEVKKIIDEVSPNYPQLTTFEKEWIHFYKYGYIPGIPVNLEYQVVEGTGFQTVNNAIPFNYKSAILKGNTDENLQSVKMPVLTTIGKNLNNSKMIYGSISGSGVFTDSKTRNASADFISVMPNEQYTLHCFDDNIEIKAYYEYDKDKNYLKQIVLKGDYGSFITLSNTAYIKFIVGKKDNSNIDKIAEKISLFKGKTTSESYEPYKSNILTVNEDVELRGVGDVRDTLDLMTGELTERIGEVVLDGSEDWSVNNSNNDGFYSASTTTYIGKPNGAIISDKLPTTQSTKAEGVMLGMSTGKIMVSFNRESNGVSNLTSFKEKLAQNPITILYELATPTVKTVKLTDKLSKPYEDTNHYETYSDTIQPIMFLEVPVVSKGNKTLLDIQNQD